METTVKKNIGFTTSKDGQKITKTIYESGEVLGHNGNGKADDTVWKKTKLKADDDTFFTLLPTDECKKINILAAIQSASNNIQARFALDVKVATHEEKIRAKFELLDIEGKSDVDRGITYNGDGISAEKRIWCSYKKLVEEKNEEGEVTSKHFEPIEEELIKEGTKLPLKSEVVIKDGSKGEKKKNKSAAKGKKKQNKHTTKRMLPNDHRTSVFIGKEHILSFIPYSGSYATKLVVETQETEFSGPIISISVRAIKELDTEDGEKKEVAIFSTTYKVQPYEKLVLV